MREAHIQGQGGKDGIIVGAGRAFSDEISVFFDVSYLFPEMIETVRGEDFTIFAVNAGGK